MALLMSLHWHLCYCFAGIVAIVAILLLPLLSGVIAHVALASWLSLCWHCHHHCAGIVAVIATAPSNGTLSC
jgi:hypothetical protein